MGAAPPMAGGEEGLIDKDDRCNTKRAPLEAVSAAATATATADSEDEEEDGMTSMEYIMAYKQLPPFEVELILEEPVERAPFAESQLFKDLSAEPSATEDDFEDALEAHEERQDMRVRFQEWARSEYEAKGYVAVSDEYIARRARVELVMSAMWKEAFADLGEEDEEEGTVVPLSADAKQSN